ncbi:glycoside hydrolase family 3 protein [Micromonospora mangrovi]|uniref:beta-N-acetylhexosaminidase n=2 Tax=Micromonospora TaxID=1873 RepID=A0AAU7MGJ4_9ACTN
MFRRITGAVVRVPVALVAACGIVLAVGGSAGAGALGRHRPDGDPGHRVDRQVRAAMAQMTLAEKVGQMFVLQVYGDTATTTNPTDQAANRALYGSDVANGAQLLARYHPGGIIYFTNTDNLNNPQQVALLSNGLQRAALADQGIPLQISTDQEGGFVSRIPPPSAIAPGNMAIGATFDSGVAFSTAAATGRQLRAMGITMDHAPVVDVNTNPRNTADGTRAFSDRTAVVSAFGAAAVTGYQGTGIAATAKHFPGLGSAEANPDTGIAVVNETREEIMRIDIPPFRAAIAAGVKSIMPTAVVVPALDPTRTPAILSRPIITGLLRDTLRYDGVVVTDALRADALAGIPQDQVILGAVDAGNDELLLPTNPPAAIATVIDAVRAGTISRQRIDQSVYRILRMKAELGLFDHPYTTSEAVDSTVGNPAEQQVMADAARRSITLLRNQAGTLPLPANSGRHVLVTGWGSTTVPALAGQLSGKGLVATPMWTGSPDQHTINQVVAAATASDVVVVLTNNARNDVTQQNLVRALLATRTPVVTVAVGGPYDIAYFPAAPTYLAAYGYRDVSLAALADVLTGGQPTGRLPVTVLTPDGTQVLFPFGSGIGYPKPAPATPR